MRARILVVLATAIFAQSSSSPDAVEDCNKLLCSLSQKTSSELKITEEKGIKKVEMKSEGVQHSGLSSQLFHQGHNLFYKPQILIGSGTNYQFLSSKVEDDKNQIVTHIIGSIKNETYSKVTNVLPEIPKAPILMPLVMPELPTPVIIKETVVIPPHQLPTLVKEITIEHDTLVIPKLPAYLLPLNPPRTPMAVILPKPLPHIPTCLVDNDRYGITVPCSPTIAVSPEIIGTEKVIVEKTLLVPQPKPILNLHLPKIPLEIVYNKPVKTLMPYQEGFISTTRYLPSVKVSKIPLERFSHQNILIHGRSSGVVVEKIRREKVKTEFSSFSAYCAHNIALERVLPNIVVRNEVIREESLPLLEIPVRPVY